MSGRGGYKMNDQEIAGAVQLSNIMSEQGTELERLLNSVGEDENVTLTQKQLTDILVLIGRLTLINTGINGAHIEESIMLSMEERDR